MQVQGNKDILTAFFYAAKSDERLTSRHLSIYFVLFGCWLNNDCQSPFSITRKAVMRKAKISVATYTKCMYELHNYGYITYVPSYHPAIGSLVFLHAEIIDKA